MRMAIPAAAVHAVTPARAQDDARDLAFAQLELALSAITRRLSSREVVDEIGRRARCELTPTALGLLEHLASSGPLRVSDVAECMRVDKSTMTQRLQALDVGDLITRASDPADRRVSVIKISGTGRRLVARVRAVRLQLLRDALPESSLEQLAGAAEILDRINRAQTTSVTDRAVAAPGP